MKRNNTTAAAEGVFADGNAFAINPSKKGPSQYETDNWVKSHIKDKYRHG